MKHNRKAVTFRYFISFLLAMALSCPGASAKAADPAGRAIFVHGSVWRMPADKAKMPLNKGDLVYETDTIMTDQNGSAQLIMSDGAYIAIRPDSRIRLDVYRYDKEEEKGLGRSIITLLKGCFRSITGMIGKENKENYRIRTSVATIGIRGTDHEPLFIPEPSDGEIPIGPPGLYDKVNSGETFMETEAGVVTILPNQVGYVSAPDALAVVVDTIPDVYDRFSAPAPEGSLESSENETTEPSMISEGSDLLSDPTALDEQAGAQQFPPAVTDVDTRSAVRSPTLFTWADTTGDSGILGYDHDKTALDTDDSGAVTGYSLPSVDSPNPDWIQTVRLVNPTAGTRGESDHYAETGISFGTWQADAIERISYDEDTESIALGNGLAHFITGECVMGSDYLTQTITGERIYDFDGGTAPTNQDGITGVLNSASLSVDFSHQSVDTLLQLTVNSHDWSAGATDIPIDRGFFTAGSPLLTVDRDGASGGTTWGIVKGTFAGPGLSGALLGYTLGDTALMETITGTAAFYSQGQAPPAPYREIGIAGTDSRTPMPPALALQATASAASLSMDGAGRLIGFDTLLPTYGAGSTDGTRSPTRLDIGSASLTDTGMDAATGIMWGRWSGTVAAKDRVTDSAVSPSFNPQDLHVIAGPEMDSPVMLPITGTKTYQLAGGTRPTDNLGNVGTLNSASLSADFTHMTVAAGINATVGATRFNANASAVPIENGRYFTATHQDALTLTCTGSGAGTTHTGIISGSFYGTHGQSAGAAYSFNTNGGAGIDTTISGTVAFKP
ncbi:hypothetical protein JCM14469_32990 [Desulfatiferula olefinivorans]